jgi:hypothetical protein
VAGMNFFTIPLHVIGHKTVRREGVGLNPNHAPYQLADVGLWVPEEESRNFFIWEGVPNFKSGKEFQI